LAVTTIFPLAAASGPTRLAAEATSVSWIALILASLLSLDRLFDRDLASGALDLLSLGPLPLQAVAAAKCLAHWLTNGVPLALAAPLGALALGAPAAAAPMVLAAALMGGLAFAFLGGTGAALALASRRGGMLIALIVLPLLIPPVIFGGAAIERFAAGSDWAGGFALLSGYALAAAALTPFAMAGGVRNAGG
jgi:heme exporter protein B